MTCVLLLELADPRCWVGDNLHTLWAKKACTRKEWPELIPWPAVHHLPTSQHNDIVVHVDHFRGWLEQRGNDGIPVMCAHAVSERVRSMVVEASSPVLF